MEQHVEGWVVADENGKFPSLERRRNNLSAWVRQDVPSEEWTEIGLLARHGALFRLSQHTLMRAIQERCVQRDRFSRNTESVRGMPDRGQCAVREKTGRWARGDVVASGT